MSIRKYATFLGCVLLGACGGEVDNAAFVSDLSSNRPAEVTVQGRVVALLADSSGPDGLHQRFRLDVNGDLVEVDHNLGLAQRVPVAVGTTVIVHGQFEPDPGHPVIHYTHHATGRHPGGWIEVNGQTYQ